MKNRWLMKIEIKIQGMDNVPSFKNSKMIVRIKGRPALITNPKKQQWMSRCITAIEFQLRSLFQTSETAMATVPRARSLILSSLPLDDSLVWIESHCVSWRKVPKGQEGFIMVVEKID